MPYNISQADGPSNEADSASDGEAEYPPAAAAADEAASPQAQDPDEEEEGSGARTPADEDPAAEEEEEEGERAEAAEDPPSPRDIALARFLREIHHWTSDRNIISYVTEVLTAGNFTGAPEFVVNNNVLMFAGIPIAELERPQFGLSRWDIRRIPGRTFEAPTCSICRDVFQEDDFIRKLPCRHEFHSNCLVDVLNSSSTCPQCGKDILK